MEHLGSSDPCVQLRGVHHTADLLTPRRCDTRGLGPFQVNAGDLLEGAESRAGKACPVPGGVSPWIADVCWQQNQTKKDHSEVASEPCSPGEHFEISNRVPQHPSCRLPTLEVSLLIDPRRKMTIPLGHPEPIIGDAVTNSSFHKSHC